MKINFFVSLIVFILLGPSISMSQEAATENMYTDYDKYISDVFRNFSSGKQNFMPRHLKEIQDNAALLKEETAPAVEMRMLKRKSKRLSTEAIFYRRKNSVFIVGKLFKYNDTAGVKYDLIGTAFAITEDGICITNYHVLQNIIRPDKEQNRDSAYFIMTPDKQIYFLDQLLAYSQNNDIAVFKVAIKDQKLSPVPLGKPAQVGAQVYCISHPLGYFYYFSKGIVARNITINSAQAVAGYSKYGKPPIRMEISADYGLLSSGGPILDKYGNLIGMVSSTSTINDRTGQTQMVIRDTAPVKAIAGLLKK